MKQVLSLKDNNWVDIVRKDSNEQIKDYMKSFYRGDPETTATYIGLTKEGEDFLKSKGFQIPEDIEERFKFVVIVILNSSETALGEDAYQYFDILDENFYKSFNELFIGFEEFEIKQEIYNIVVEFVEIAMNDSGFNVKVKT